MKKNYKANTPLKLAAMVPSDLDERSAPHNIEAEQALLGAIFVDNAALGLTLPPIGTRL